MDHYLDIQVLPDPEFPPSMLLNALYAKLHRVLVSSGRRDIGVSFPAYRAPEIVPNAKAEDKPPKKINGSLGQILRLHSTHQALSDLMAINWLHGMCDHLVLSEIAFIPANATHGIVRRVQATQSRGERVRQRLLRRVAKRAAYQQITLEQAIAQIPSQLPDKWVDLPFLTLKSQSTGQYFRFFIHQASCVAGEKSGEFNAYALSSKATLPFF